MSNTSAYVAVVASWLGSAGAALGGFIRHAKKVEAQVANYATEAKTSVDGLLTELQKINETVAALAPKPKPAVAAKAPAKKIIEAPKPRRAGR
jgi:hypothetical protein